MTRPSFSPGQHFRTPFDGLAASQPTTSSPHVRNDATVYICGSAGFAAAASELAMESGFDAGSIRVERFGPSG